MAFSGESAAVLVSRRFESIEAGQKLDPCSYEEDYHSDTAHENQATFELSFSSYYRHFYSGLVDFTNLDHLTYTIRLAIQCNFFGKECH